MSILSVVERVFMRLSHSRRVDGMWIGVLGDRKDDALLARVEQSLMLIKQYDPVGYRRLHRNIERIWIAPLLAARGEFNFSSRRCDLDYRFVKSSEPDMIASTIVHEATHAHPCMRKLGYAEARRYRIERICMRRQLAFAARLPDSAKIREHLERNLALAPAFWRTESLKRMQVESGITTLRAQKVPEWLIRLILMLRGAIGRFRRRSP
jgi:hypothetical protein